MKSRYIKVNLLSKAKSPFGRIIVLTGARQTGKTTLARLAFPQYKYLSIEDPLMRIEYKTLTAAQWNLTFPFAILDEVQKEPTLIESIKSVYDQYPEPRYLLLGSSQLMLLKKVKESLAGRCSIFEIYPLTIPEIRTKSWDEEIKNSLLQDVVLKQKDADDILPFTLWEDFAERKAAFDHYLKLGGYPALVDDTLDDDERYHWLRNYIRTYLERDIRDLADFKSLEPFVKLQKITALLTGQMMNYSLLGKEAGISSATAKRYLQYLELSYQVVLLKPWHRNKLKRLLKTPKIHYLDPGIKRTIVAKTGSLTGHEYESAIIAEIIKQLKNIHFAGDYYHLRTHDGFEVDFLIELEDAYIPI
ncbi:MAG TPA: ATP-binding protein, partial [Phaeodactylibacter sp.]|nr:ATP-binding protein [Phaeodactylibacter sp.]